MSDRINSLIQISGIAERLSKIFLYSSLGIATLVFSGTYLNYMRSLRNIERRHYEDVYFMNENMVRHPTDIPTTTVNSSTNTQDVNFERLDAQGLRDSNEEPNTSV